MATYKPGKKRFFFRSSGFTATFSMSLVLFLIGLITLIYFLAKDMTTYVKENINLSVVLKEDTPDEEAKRIQQILQRAAFTKSVEFISKEQALQDHIDNLGDDPKAFLGYNPLLASIEVKMKSEYANNDSVAKIEQQLKKQTSIQQVVYQKNMISMVNDNIKKITYILLGLAGVLLLISLVLLNNTVKLSVYANRFLINTMKLVGASRWFIRKPYIGKSVVNGLIAAVIALGLLTALVYYLQYEFGLQISAIQPLTIVSVAIVVIGMGVLLTALSSYFAVGKYLRMRTDDMYYI